MRSLFFVFLILFSSIFLTACKGKPPVPGGTPANAFITEPEDDLPIKLVKSARSRQLVFTSESDAQTLAKGGEKVVYFFKTGSCTSCKSAQKDLDQRLSTFSTQVTVIVVDSDKEKALKEKYALSSDHTWIQIDGDGKVITKWQGGTTDELVNNIK